MEIDIKCLRVKAFSIIELTIVIILMGLLSIVILTGGQLIAEAKTRSIINKITDFEKAIFMFQKLHEFLPGDFPHTNIWLDADIANTCYKITDEKGTVATGADRPDQTFIKGDGDGLVGDGVRVGIYETELVTCHLVLGSVLNNTANIGLGIMPKATPYADPKELKFKAGYFIDNVNRLSVWTSNSNWPPGNSIYLSSSMKDPQTTNPNTTPVNTNIAFATLKAIDIKIDDGKPGTGQIIFGSYNDDKKLCSEMGGKYYCTPSSTFSTTTAKNEKGIGWLIYRPRWLSGD